MNWLNERARSHRESKGLRLTSTEKTIITVVVVYAVVIFGLVINLIRDLWS